MQMKAVFLDKDGTLIEDVPFNVNPHKIKLYPGVGEALAMLQAEGYKLIVITNQSGIALGYFDEPQIDGVIDTLAQLLQPYGVKLDGFYYCPHHTHGKIEAYTIECNCRKPKPGMIRQAALEMGIDLAKSWMVGDILNDVEAGNRAGCNTILVDNGNETEWTLGGERMPTYIVDNLKQAVEKIRKHEDVIVPVSALV